MAKAPIKQTNSKLVITSEWLNQVGLVYTTTCVAELDWQKALSLWAKPNMRQLKITTKVCVCKYCFVAADCILKAPLQITTAVYFNNSVHQQVWCW